MASSASTPVPPPISHTIIHLEPGQTREQAGVVFVLCPWAERVAVTLVSTEPPTFRLDAGNLKFPEDQL